MTKKQKILNYVETFDDGATWKQIWEFILSLNGLKPDRKYRGRFSAYFSAVGNMECGYLLIQKGKDQRYLKKINKKYFVKYKIEQEKLIQSNKNFRNLIFS